MTRETLRQFGRGVAVGWSVHFLQIPVLALLMFLLTPIMGYLVGAFILGLVLFAGTTQVLYMVPLIVRGIRRGERAYVSGLCCAGIMLCLVPIVFFVMEELRRPLP